MNLRKSKILVIVGPTASGKTSLAVDLARKFNGEIISADSRQVYRGMDIGTGKDLEAYGEVPYHLIDIVEPNETFDLAQFKKLAEAAISEVLSRDKLPIVVGGTGLYVEALIDNFQLAEVKANSKLRDELEAKATDEIFEIIQANNPSFAAKINHSDVNNKRRLIRYAEVLLGSGQMSQKGESGYEPLIIGLNWPKEELRERIEARLMDRLDNQEMVEEVNDLNRQGVSWERLESFGLEYKFIAWYLQEKVDEEQMIDRLKKASWQFAKRQLTWLRRWQRSGAKITWCESGDFTDLDRQVTKFLQD
jgi:tRNA dimethylallyltransferase